MPHCAISRSFRSAVPLSDRRKAEAALYERGAELTQDEYLSASQFKSETKIVQSGERNMIQPMLRSIVTTGFAVMLASSAALAADAPYHADLAHTQILFAVNHMGKSTMHGVFKKFTVDLKFDPQKPEKTQVSTVIDASSVDTGFDPRDTHLKSPDFFNVAKFPSLTFKSTKVDMTGADTAKVTGNLTMLGVTKPVTFDAKLSGQGAGMMGGMVYGFSMSGTLKRSDWGMSKYTPMLGDDVAFTIESEVNNAPPMPPPPAAPKN